MEGQIKRIIPSGEFVTFIIHVKDVQSCSRTFTGQKYRNFAYWRDLKVGDWIAGLRWLDEAKGIIDADSPVYLLQDTLF